MADDNCLNCKHIKIQSDNIKNPIGICYLNPQPVRKQGKDVYIGCGQHEKGAMNKLAPEKVITEKPPLRNSIVAEGGVEEIK
jgi:hypothetical protein